PRPAEPRDAYTAVLRLGRKGAKRTARRFDRLTPLPSADNPYLVYLGVTETEEAVSFLLSTDVRATGDGKCLPNKTSCESIELRRGQSAELEVTSDDGRLTRWVLDLVRIDKTGKAAPSRAVAARDAS
ncbi:MAG: hypothetical protein JWO90_1664, partial [Solirubrobacterales bacterium]|nr:hypothetical protein [Solirubrobacterales bacterium]